VTSSLPSTPEKKPGKKPEQKPEQRSAAEIENEIDATRRRLTSTLDELSVRMQPDQLGKDVSEVAFAAAEDGKSRVKVALGLQPAPDGSSGIRPEVIGALAGAGLAILILLIRSRRQSVSYKLVLPNDSTTIDEILVRATGGKVPRGIAVQRV